MRAFPFAAAPSSLTTPDLDVTGKVEDSNNELDDGEIGDALYKLRAADKFSPVLSLLFKEMVDARDKLCEVAGELNFANEWQLGEYWAEPSKLDLAVLKALKRLGETPESKMASIGASVHLEKAIKHYRGRLDGTIGPTREELQKAVDAYYEKERSKAAAKEANKTARAKLRLPK